MSFLALDSCSWQVCFQSYNSLFISFPSLFSLCRCFVHVSQYYLLMFSDHSIALFGCYFRQIVIVLNLANTRTFTTTHTHTKHIFDDISYLRFPFLNWTIQLLRLIPCLCQVLSIVDPFFAFLFFSLASYLHWNAICSRSHRDPVNRISKTSKQKGDRLENWVFT